MKTPLVAILCNRSTELGESYRDYFQSAGFALKPVIYSEPDLDRSLSGCDALVLTGGGDFSVVPGIYENPDEASRADLAGLNPLREQMEQELLAWAMSHKKPVFAICRGMQAVNVILGGSLIPDICGRLSNMADPAHRLTGADVSSALTRPDAYHDLLPEPGEWYASLLDESLSCNSHHHQALDRVADTLVIEAAAPDGVVEAVRHELLPILGVQFHPERMAGQLPQLLLRRWRLYF